MTDVMPKPSYRYYVYTAVFSSGERFPILLNQASGQPTILPTRYVVDRRRDFCQASTIEHDVRVLGWFYEWGYANGLDIDNRLRTGPPPNGVEIRSLSQYLRMKRSKKVIGVIDPPYARDESSEHLPVLQPSVFNTYLAAVRSFILWALETQFKAHVEAPERMEHAIAKVAQVFQAQKLNIPVPTYNYGLSTEDSAFLLQCVHPESKCNPFNKPSRLRIYLIFRLLLETGIRRGELCKLRIQDLNTRGGTPHIKVVRQPDALEDPRRREPRVKTRERIIPITRHLCGLIVQYLQTRHRQIAHPYLFVNTRTSAPLTLDGVTEVFLHVGRRFERFENVDLTPHTMRRTFNDRLLDAARQRNWNERQVGDLQKYLNGWSEQSHQSAVYARRFIEQSALELAAEMQKGLYEENERRK
jgi:integrase